MKLNFPSVLSVGNFDGVHRGHAALIESLIDFKRTHPSINYRSIVLTFEPHPIEVLRPGTTVARLSGVNEKLRLIKKLGIDDVVVIPFSPSLSQMEAFQFWNEHILSHKPHYIAVGKNFFFGKGRLGTPELLKKWAEENKIVARVFEPLESDGVTISSSRIRSLIENGDVYQASRLLGRDYSFSGEVVHGDKRGRLLGFPTANVVPQIQNSGRVCLPKNGVYITSTIIGARTFASITNVGVRPTIKTEAQTTVETHILNFSEEIYGQIIQIEFRERLRDEKKFASLEELKKQIESDKLTAQSRI